MKLLFFLLVLLVAMVNSMFIQRTDNFHNGHVERVNEVFRPTILSRQVIAPWPVIAPRPVIITRPVIAPRPVFVEQPIIVARPPFG